MSRDSLLEARIDGSPVQREATTGPTAMHDWGTEAVRRKAVDGLVEQSGHSRLGCRGASSRHHGLHRSAHRDALLGELRNGNREAACVSHGKPLPGRPTNRTSGPVGSYI